MSNPIAPGASGRASLRGVRLRGYGGPPASGTAPRVQSPAMAHDGASADALAVMPAMRGRGWRPLARGVLLLALLLPGTLLIACSGSTGSSGAAGTAGANTPVGNGLRNVGTATAITGQVTAVAIGGPPVVNFHLVDQDGVALSGLPASDIAFAVAKLVPGQNGASSYWSSYIYSTVKPVACPTGVTACATAPKVQATTENGATGTLVDNGDGTYVYTFKKDITTDPLVNFDPSLTHRVGFEIRGLAQANNGSLTFEPATGATTGITSREIVDTATCDGCHTRLSAHGGARVDVQYCVLCHNPGTADPTSGNSLDMRVMVHKIHTGSALPSIQALASPSTPVAGAGYWIVGYGNSVSNFNTVVYPQDQRNCQACHAQNHPNLTEAANFKTMPSIEACGACHDNVNFATGLNHSTNIIANNTQCSTCHGATSAIDGGKLQAVTAHLIPERVFQAKLAFNILGASGTGPGQTPVIRFSVTDPSNGNTPYNVLTDDPFVHCADPNASPNLSIGIAWSTTDYTNVGSGASATNEVGQPINMPVVCGAALVPPVAPPVANGDGTFSITSPTPIPSSVRGSAGLLFQGHVVHDFNDGRVIQEIPVPNVIAFAPITDATAVARREVAPVAKCDVCHSQLNGHGGNKLDSVQACATCHDPNATDVLARIAASPSITPASLDPTDHLAEQTIDLKVMIHAIHAPTFRASQGGVPYVVYHRGSPTDFSKETPFPGLINNCLACHAADTYYPPDPTTSTVLATTISTYSATAPLTSPAGETAVTPAASACSSCHQSALAQAHMVQNGGNFAVTKDAQSHFTATTPETCTVCHGPGAVADVKVVHNVAALQ